MQEEIFGPLLPVIAFDDIGEALSAVNGRDKPLALYLYSENPALAERALAETSSGSVCVNHNVLQLGVPTLPFGGVGASGFGAYHGRWGFAAFSHNKAVFRRPSHGELPILYPPYSRTKRWLFRKVL
jgi:aldehyde dehydrogenase (NAD+)